MQLRSGLIRLNGRAIAIAALQLLRARIAPSILVTLVIVLQLAPAAWAQYTESALHTFTGGSDGSVPYAGVISDSKGNLYGATYYGGNTSACKASGYPPGCGVVFELSPPESGGSSWTETVLYSFCPAGGSPCTDTDGLNPYSSLVFDSGGNLYGTTVSGGVNSSGTVFKLSPPGSGVGPWTETVLYNFCSVNNPVDCFDGSYPYGNLIFDSKGNLYGTAAAGGGPYEDECSNSCGLVFELSPPSGGSGPWTETVLASFGGIDSGGTPYAGLVFDSKGNLYGTLFSGNGGGDYDDGVVFELSPTDSGSGPWTETVPYSFSGTGGSNPFAGLTFDSKGNLYGTTEGGGAIGGGVVFQLTPPSDGSGPWTETLPYSFKGGSDGGTPDGTLIVSAQGNLYGTTLTGGTNRYGCSGAGIDGCGVAFELRPPSSGSGAWTETVLYTFTGESDGALPHAGLTIDSRGNLYGSASAGGDTTTANCPGGILVQPGCGVLFELAPNTATAVSSSLNPSPVGKSVTFTATVSGGSSPTGTVTFTSNGAALSGCSAVVLASNHAACSTVFAVVGAYSIAASYSGDAKNGASAGTLTQVVSLPLTTTTVTSSANPSTSGESLTLTATVAPAGPPTPTGSVEFTALGTVLSGCSAVTLSSSRIATCTTSTLPVGTDAIVATYSGDSNYSGSSGTLSQLVNPVPMPVQFFSVTPCRVVDTREAIGPFGGPELAAGATRSFTIPSGPCAGIPSTAVAYSLNVTVVPPAALGYLTIWPA
ncbi:MAG: choice-of-anchor tandem repeat GloVer-containing protein, partial [Terriglobales bacterium]